MSLFRGSLKDLASYGYGDGSGYGYGSGYGDGYGDGSGYGYGYGSKEDWARAGAVISDDGAEIVKN